MLGVTPRYAEFFHDTPSAIMEALLVSAVLAVACFAAGILAAFRQPLDDRLAVIISFGIINNILVVVFSSEFFGPIEPLVAMVYTVPFFCSIVFLRAYALWSSFDRVA
jgi:BASS family bile acid:Na+ symporter